MGQPFVGEIRMFAGNFAPQGWFLCQGTLKPISTYTVLFQLIGTTYGGDGTTTFRLPDLRGRMPVQVGTGNVLGQIGGEEQVLLTVNQMPNHRHAAAASSNHGNQSGPAGALWAAASGGSNPYSSTTPPPAQLAADALSSVGGGQAHDNLSPYLAINFIIAWAGIFPTTS